MLSTTNAMAVCALIACAGVGGAMSGNVVVEPSLALTQQPSQTTAFPAINSDAKSDRLDVTANNADQPSATFTVASVGPTSSIDFPAKAASPPPVENVTRPTTIEAAPATQHKPKPVAVKPAALKTVLSDTQIAGFRQRLKLSSSQEGYWSSVEQALRGVIRELDDAKRRNPSIANSDAIDASSTSVQRLKMAAFPLLMSMGEEQKQEVRTLARTIGLHQVAAQI